MFWPVSKILVYHIWNRLSNSHLTMSKIRNMWHLFQSYHFPSAHVNFIFLLLGKLPPSIWVWLIPVRRSLDRIFLRRWQQEKAIRFLSAEEWFSQAFNDQAWLKNYMLTNLSSNSCSIYICCSTSCAVVHINRLDILIQPSEKNTSHGIFRKKITLFLWPPWL
jgi:hypothetical protein